MQGSIVHVRKSDITDAKIALPSKIEQIAIARILLHWDDAIRKAEQLLAAKKRRLDVLFNQLIFGSVRSGVRNVKLRKSLHWFAIPDDWQIVEIRDIAKEITVSNGKIEGLPVLSCTKHDGLVNSLEYFDKQVFSLDTSKYKVVRRGQFAYATNHIEEGSIGYQNLVPAGLVSPIYSVFQTDNSKSDDGYLYKLLKTERLRKIFAARTNASVDRRGSLRWSEFSKIEVPLPPLDEQRQISAALDTAKHEIVLLDAQAEAYKRQKSGLMQKLVTGQWLVQLPTK